MKYLFTILIGILSSNCAATELPDIQKYITSDVAAVGYVDLTKVDLPEALAWIKKMKPELIAPERIGENAEKIQTGISGLTKNGADIVYLFFRTSDVVHRGPALVIPVAESGNPEEIKKLLSSSKFSQLGIRQWGVVHGTLFGAPSEERLEEVSQISPNQDRDLDDAFAALGGGHCGLIVFGDDDTRKVVRDLFPKLPSPFEKLDGPLIADHLRWGGISIDLPPTPKAKVLIETTDGQTAQVIEDAAGNALKLLDKVPMIQESMPGNELAEVLKLLVPKVDGNQVSLGFENLTEDAELLIKLISPPFKAASEAKQRRRRMNQFKMIGLGLLNYESVNGKLPPASVQGNDKDPMLSWRVHILPYMDQGDLYKQFHLDEPWDSLHNKKLISKMPDFYADSDPALKSINSSGRTTFLMPAHAETIAYSPEGTKYKEITDGTSNTIMTVEVVPERAVLWTQPADWEVDLESPLEGLKREDRKYITTGFCDGSVRIIDAEIDPKMLRGLLTRAGEEVIEW